MSVIAEMPACKHSRRRAGGRSRCPAAPGTATARPAARRLGRLLLRLGFWVWVGLGFFFFFPSVIVKKMGKIAPGSLLNTVSAGPSRRFSREGTLRVQIKAPLCQSEPAAVSEGSFSRCAPTRVFPAVFHQGALPGTGYSFASGQVPVENSYLKQTQEPPDHHHHRGAALGLTPPLMTDGWCH